MSEFDFLTAGEIETLAFASAKKEAAEARADVIEPVQTELQKGDAAEFSVPIQPEQAKEAGIPDQPTVQEHRVPVFTPEEQKKKELRAKFEAAPVLDSFDKHGRIDLHNPITTKYSSYKGDLICNAIVKGDYSFILNPKLREKIENIGRVSSDPERHRKSLALAAYIFNMGLNKEQTVGYVFDHIDEYIQPGGFFGNSGTVDGAYDHIRNVMTLKPLDNDVTDAFKDKFWTKPVGETKFAVWTSAQAENIAAGVFEVPAFFIGGNMKYNPICLGLGYLYELGTPGTTQMQKNMGMNFAERQAARSREIEDWITTPARFYHEEGAAAVQILQQELGYDPDFINKARSGEMGWGDFFANAGIQLGIIAPKLYVDIALGVYTRGASIFATSAAQAKYAYLRENPQASEYEADSYGALMGAIELVTEAITLKMGKGWLGKLSGINKDLMCTSFGAALARTAKNWGEEALSEEAATFLGNVVDGLYGQWDPEKSFTQNIFSDIGAGTIYSLPTSLIFSAPDYINIKHNQKLANLHAQTQQMIQTLENQETLSETENVLLKLLKMIEDSGDYEALGKVLDMAKTEQYLREQREAAADAAPANTTTITGEDGSQAVQQTQFAEDATAEALQTAAADVQRLQLKKMMPHNPEDTEQAVLQEAGAYGVPIQTTRAWTDEQVQILIERAGIPQDIAPGDRQKFIDRIKMKQEAIWNPDGTITINTAVVRPSCVPFVVAHELLVHEGLARVFNPSAKKELMDTIWKDFGETDLMKSIVRRYRLRRSRTDEVGQVYQEEMTDPERREAAEEFLAHLGETNGVPLETIYTQNQDEIDAWARSKKLQGSREHLTREWMYETGYRPERPGWLRQLISAIRVWLRQHGFTKLVSTLSDQDIQYILAKAAKADLSKRRARNGEAARLAIFGEEGVRRMENAVQLLENLATAKQMTADGKDAKVIKLATGWELGGDGKWRMEMPDAVFTTRAKLPDGAEYDRTLWDVVNTTNGKLSEYVVADEIFEAYPELKDYHFQIGQMPSGVGGSFNPDTKTIYINQLGLTSALKMVDDAQARLSDETLTAAERKKAQHSVDLWTEQIFSMINETLVHEVQHAIQHIEGFATGSNVRRFIDNPEYDPKRLEKVSYYSEKFESARQNLEKYPELKKMVDRYVELEDVLFSDDNVQVDEAAIDAEMDQIKAHFESIGKRELFMDYITGRDNYTMAKDAAEKHKLDPVESYRRTAGEVEARNVQRRRNYTMEERLNSLLSETEDVAEKDKIYLNGLVRGNSNLESGMRDAELEILQAFPKHKSFQAKEILKSIADKDLKNIETGIDAKINTNQYNKMTSNAAVNKSLRNGFSRDDHFEALANIEVLYQNAVLLEHTEDLKNNDSNVKIYRFASPFVIKNDICDVLLTVKETISSNQRRVYTLELTEIKKLSERGSTKPNSQYYTDSLYKLHQKHEKIKRFLNKTSEKINGEGRIGTDGYGDDNSRLSVSPDADAEYLAAVERGDMEAAQRMVEEAARAKGYSADDNWRLGHRAPSSRLVAEDPDGPTQRITDWKKVVPEDYFDHPDWYTSSPEERESFFALKRALDLYEQRKAEGKGREKYVGLRVYRAVDKTVNSKESEFRNGDWVTPSKTYAEMEGEGNTDGSRIIMHWVPLEHLYWNGDSIAELGYDDGKNYAYADTKNNRKLLDPVTYDDDGNVIPLSKRFNKRSDDVRSSLINLELTEDERSLVNIMKVLVSGQFDPDFDYAQRVKDVYGLEVSAEDAKFAAMVALREKKADAQRAAREKAYAYFRSNNPLFEFIDDFAGGFHDFHIVPVNGKGEKFTGTFIAPEYVRWSEKRPQGKNESDKQYQNYLQKREEALKKAKGYDSADLAEAYARKTGLDTVTVEQEIVELFRDLKKPDILSTWKKYKDENLGMSRQEQEMLKKSQEDYFRNMAEDAAMEVLEAGQPVITEDWIKQNRDVFEVLYEQLTGKKEAPYKLSKSDMETLNAAIVQDHGAGSVYFAARKEAREASRQEFEKRLAEFRQAVQAREVNTMNLQRELVDFIRKNLPGDLHGKYEKRIISLMKLKTDYKREEVFQNILSDMLEDSLNSKRHDLIKRITDMLERNKTKRTDKNVPYSPMGDRQQVLDRIFKIVRMSEGTVALSRGVHAERLEAIEKTLEGYSDDQDRAEEQIKLQQEKKEIERDLFYLEHYGNLSHKEIEEIDNSMKMLEKFIRKGRDEFKSRLDERAQRTRVLRESLRMEMSRGSLSVPHKDSLDIRENKLYRYALNNLSLSQQVRMFSRQEDDLKFHDSTHGKILAMIEDSTQKEATFIRKGQQRLDEVYTKLGIKNKIVLGKFLSSLEQEQDTGIDIPMYVTVKKSARDPKITYTSEAAGRQKLTGSFNVEHIRHLNELLEEGLQITSILRTGSLENYRAIAEEIRSDLGVPLEGGFTVCLEHDGSFRVLTGNESGGITDHHFGRHQMTATMQQRMAEEDALFPIDQYARASIRARVEEYDAGMDTSYKPDTGDDIDNAALAAAEKSERGDRVKAPHVMLLAANPQNMVEGKKRLKISPAAAVQLLLEWEQDNYKLNFDFYGFTEEKIAALKSWLEINHSGALKLGYALRDLVFEQRGELDAAVFEKYGVHLPETKNFWYGDFSSNMADQIRDAGYGNPVGGLTVSANFLTGRKFHLQKPGTKTSFMNLFMMRQLETAHFIAYSQTIRDIRAIYNSSEVQNIMIREFGIDALLEWKKGLEQLASGGEISNFKTLQALANYIHEIFYPANVALNLKSVCSQIAGGTAYALYVPPAQLIKRLPFNRNNKKYRDFLETVMKSDYFLNRMNGSGFDPYMNTFLNPYSKKKVTPIKDSIIQKSMALTLWGDKVSSTTFGYAAYSYFYDQALKNGKTVAEAKQYALQMWERATDETQQSGYTKDRNKFNTNPGILRALTAYMTSPMQQFGLELSSILRACKDPNKKNLTEAGRRILINHFVSTTIFNLIASAFRHGFNFGDYLEDWEDYVRGWILGQMDSLFLVGTVLTETFNLLTGNGLFYDEKSLLPMKENFVRDYRKIKSDITGRSEVDWLDYLQASGDVMMSAGPAPSRLFGGALYITSREIRRARRWFEGDEDKERKKKKAAR